jgi:hypothetical protein
VRRLRFATNMTIGYLALLIHTAYVAILGSFWIVVHDVRSLYRDGGQRWFWEFL